MRGALAAGLLLCVVSIPVFPQSSNATLGGTVSDTSRALIPGVSVTATNTGTGVATTAISNESGSYQFPPLQPGTYKVRAELPGFQTQTFNDVSLGISQQVRLNFTLQVGNVATAVEVNIAADTLLATTSASVGVVLPEYKLRDLPLAGRDVIDLIATAPGTRDSNFAGAPQGFTMTTRDGIPVNQGRYNSGAFTQTFISPDLVEEVRVIVAPADAEYGRGSGQVQMMTRSGTNQFRGSVFWSNRNSFWDAATFNNNFNRVGKDYLNRNQYGGRVGGPIIKNKTFFFFLFEGQRTLQKSVTNAFVLTDAARQGNFRYFPGAPNVGATAANAVVDLAGNPVRPANATGDLNTLSVFGRDPNRLVPDQSGLISKILNDMPRANNFEAATGVDGLNVARFTWLRRQSGNDTLSGGSEGDFTNRTQYNFRVDHNFNQRHKVNFAGTLEHAYADLSLSQWPSGFNGSIDHHPRVYTGSFVSTLSPSLVNEFRFGYRRGKLDALQAYDNAETGKQALATMGTKNGIPFTIEGVLWGQSSQVFADNGSIGNSTPLLTLGNNVSWTRGKHAFKGGVEHRRQAGNAWNSDEIVPAVHLGPSEWNGPLGTPGFGPGINMVQREYPCLSCGIAVQGISSTTFAGINANDVIRAQALLTDLSGSIGSISEAFSLRPDPKNIVWLDYSQYYQKYRDFRQTETSWFFKDDWKLRPDLTLNLGVRWEFYGVPYESHGMMARPLGGSNGLFGLSGNSFADWYKPGERGKLTTVEFVGKSSPNSGTPLYENDWNNFAPAIGLSWNVPWGGKDKTVLRAGYGVAYQGRFAGGGGLGVDINVGLAPSLNQFAQHAISAPAELSLSNIQLPVPERNPPGLPVVSTRDRSQGFTAYDINTVTPYIHNFNVELQHEIARNLTLEVRYIGSKGTKLENTLHLNNPIIEENGLLQAFNLTKAGGDAPLFNSMLQGLTIPSVGLVDGTTLTGSAAMRQWSSTRNFLANENVKGLADFLNRTNALTNEVGGLLRRANLPENFIVTNPQFGSSTFGGAAIVTNLANSTYHSLHVSATKRLSQGFTNQTTYSWSKSLGTFYMDPRNRSSKSLQTFHRTHEFRSNGTYQLPLGPNQKFLGSAPSWVSRIVEHWQLGGIFSWNSGAPLSFVAGPNPFMLLAPGGAGTTNNFPNVVGAFPKDSGQVTISKTQPGRIDYFPGLQRVTDPLRNNITTSQTLRTASNLFAIADANGNLLLTNPEAGKIGNMGAYWIEGPGQIGLNANLLKRIRLRENKEFEIRLDAINVLNHPNFSNPVMDILNPAFGTIPLPGAPGSTGPSPLPANAGNRQFTFNARLNF
jgi:hypothetical protein